MNGIIRSALRTSTLRSFLSQTSGMNNQLNRTLWNMCRRQCYEVTPLATRKIQTPTNFCNCGCCRNTHTKAEKDLVEFLAEEIVAEKKAQKVKTIPTELEGFKVSLDGAEVTLEKQKDDEKIVISFNINHTVDSDSEPEELNSQDDNPDLGELKSKPTFTIDIKRGNQTLGFTCSFNSEPGASGADDAYNDIFGIDELTLYEGKHDDKSYAIGGEIIDGYLYDLLMNYLEEKGISNEFVEKLCDLSTNYERTAYVSLLEGLSKFTSKK